MSLVKPFRGVRFHENAGAMENLMAPPYDVISDADREKLYAKSDYNVVRISKSREINEEAENDQYQIAAGHWQDWREKGITIADDEPSFYLYDQEFEILGQKYNRLGLVCAHRLVEFGHGVLPHEKTLSGPKVDRHRLLTKTKTHFGQIFGLYPDQEGKIDSYLREIWNSSEELYEAKDEDGVIHRLRRVFADEQVQKISQMFEGQPMIIADGHHRYETALKYSKEMGTAESSCLMMTAVSAANPGLVILPTHRLLKNVENFNVEALLERLEPSFEITRLKCTVENKDEMKNKLLSTMAHHQKEGGNAFGLYSGNHEFVLLVKKEGVTPAVEGSDVFKKLDVVVLHKSILEDHLGIDDEKLAQQTNVEYIKDTGHAIDDTIAKIDQGSHQAVFLMNHTPVDQTKAVAESGEKMPQKSTFFFPKVFTGLVTYSIEKGVIND